MRVRVIYRKRAGLTGQELGRRVGMSQASISRLETGATSVDKEMVRRLASHLDLSDEEAKKLIDSSVREFGQDNGWRSSRFATADRQVDIGRLEAASTEIRVFQNAVVVGLLQTGEYARALFTGMNKLGRARFFNSPADIPVAVSGRLQRQTMLGDPRRRVHLVMMEAVLANRVCGPAEMLGQLVRIDEVAAAGNVSVRILPTGVLPALPSQHGFELLDDRCVLVDLMTTTVMSRSRTEVELYREAFDAIEEHAVADIQPILDRYYDRYLEESRRERWGTES